MLDALSSKKFIVLVLGIAAVIVCRKLGLGADLEALIAGMVGTYQVGQGLADHGKEAAKITAGAALDAPMPAGPSSSSQAGFAKLQLLAALGLLTLALLAIALPACGWLKQEAHDAKVALVDCTKGAAADAAKQFAPVVEALVAQASTPDGKLSADPVKELAKGFTRELGGCAVAKAFADLLHPTPEKPDAPKAAQLELDVASVRAVFEQVRREQFGGAAFKTDVGVL